MNQTTNELQKRKILEGIPKIAFAPIHDGQYELTPFPSCLKACLEYLNQKFPYYYLLSTSGAAFRLVWHSKRWEGGNVDIMFLDNNPLKPFFRAFEAVGYSTEIFLNRNYASDLDLDDTHLKDRYIDEEAMKRKILKSIDQGIPVIGLGVVGPPEASIIAGYDNFGETLLGWSVFQDQFDPNSDLDSQEGLLCPPTGFDESGYYRKDDWYFDTLGIITIREKNEINTAQIYQNTLKWIIDILKTPMVNDFYAGLKAYDAYIEKMLDDNEFPSDDLKTLTERKMVHYDAMTMIYERGGGSLFLKDIAAHSDFKKVEEELIKAANLFQDTSEQMKEWWNIVGPIQSDEEKQVKIMADSEVRAKFVSIIRKCRDNDEKALDLLEQALKNL